MTRPRLPNAYTGFVLSRKLGARETTFRARTLSEAKRKARDALDRGAYRVSILDRDAGVVGWMEPTGWHPRQTERAT